MEEIPFIMGARQWPTNEHGSMIREASTEFVISGSSLRQPLLKRSCDTLAASLSR